jgi:hypothetical protein
MGSVAMSMVDNPTQQTVWSLVAKGANGPLAFGAMQPRYLNPTGHSPYTQTLQKKGALIVATAPTTAVPAQPSASQQLRKEHAADPLSELLSPEPGFSQSQWAGWMEQARKSASTWLFIPRNGTLVDDRKEGVVVRAGQTFVFIRDLGDRRFWISPTDSMLASLSEKHPLQICRQYRILVSAGTSSGFMVQAAEARDYPSIDAFRQQINEKTRLDRSQWTNNGRIRYTSLEGDKLEMQYEASDLRCSGWINGKRVDYTKWADGAVYQSPFVQIRDGLMRFTDGRETYLIDCRGERPEFSVQK